MIKIRRCDEPLWRSGEVSSMADAALAAEIVGNAARSGRGLVERSGMEVIYAVYEKDRQQLIAAFVFGSPVDMPNGDVVWRQDRIELLMDALKSGRRPYSSGF
jgi:2-hydroxychromene-2-carboxylate isomerase